MQTAYFSIPACLGWEIGQVPPKRLAAEKNAIPKKWVGTPDNSERRACLAQGRGGIESA